MTKSVLKATSTADFLAALPRLIGFDPNSAPESAYLVFIHGAQAKSTARVDLPTAPTSKDDLLAWLKGVVWLALQPDADAIALVIHTAAPLTEDPGASNAGTLAVACYVAAELAGIPVTELAAIGSDGWAGFLVDRAGAPNPRPTRHPLTDITDSKLHDPEQQLVTLEEWRQAHPDQVSSDVADILRLAKQTHPED